MSDGVPNHTIYPKRYWEASISWQNWNKLTAVDIHNEQVFQTKQEYHGQNVYFYGNHPIQYIRVVGLLVGIEQMSKYTIMTIDDSSGACIDVKIERRQMRTDDDAAYPSNTTVDDVDVMIHMSFPTLHLKNKPIEIGTILEVKGTVSTFRHIRQIDLKRLHRIKDTNAEAAAWAKTAQWKKDVLSQPWIMTSELRCAIDRRIYEADAAEKRRARKKREYDVKKHLKHVAHEQRAEERRKRAEMKLNLGALKGSGVIAAPWD
ncbi:hypothetical protein LTR62_000018 [Meristemomyces frigidus]|uniref:CST complex subunit STN1 n=1 Tax=Meristemomyces frigidus TaxID=1508187 RepID=A0AAN7TYF7_9PEZI|nr:hypothetical protein LTR62_000018 [Meristemomyces frigidus]